MILLENCELGEDGRRRGGGGKKNNAGVFHCIGEVERVTNRIEVGQPRKIFQGKTGCKKGSFDPSTFVQSSREFLSARAAASFRNSSQFTYT